MKVYCLIGPNDDDVPLTCWNVFSTPEKAQEFLDKITATDMPYEEQRAEFEIEEYELL